LLLSGNSRRDIVQLLVLPILGCGDMMQIDAERERDEEIEWYMPRDEALCGERPKRVIAGATPQLSFGVRPDHPDRRDLELLHGRRSRGLVLSGAE
jgi:hypothetical protein